MKKSANHEGRLVVVVLRDPRELASRAADVVGAYLRSTPEPKLGLATGGSVQSLYDELVRRHRIEGLSFAGTRGFLLDEYIGLGRDHPQRYRNVIEAALVARVDIDRRNVHGPDGDASSLDLECARYDRMVSQARVGLQILGVGRNGHLAFNEPGSPLDSRTRVVKLAPSTRADNARFFRCKDRVPPQAITQGLGTIMQAAHLLVLAVGPSKADAVRKALEGPITAAVPASVLQRHSRVTALLDPASARLTRFRVRPG